MERVAQKITAKWRSEDVKAEKDITFKSFLLSERINKGLRRSGFRKPSPIQLKAIPLGRCGADLIIQSKSGTGKTCVFAVVALEVLKDLPNLQVLILAPTREIAYQNCSVINTIGQAVPNLQCHTFIGGMPLADDVKRIRNCQIAVGTPGRIKHLIEMKSLLPGCIRLFILDEADKMIASNLQDETNWIFNQLPVRKQVLAASATFPPEVKELVENYMRSPIIVSVSENELALKGLLQFYYVIENHAMSHIVFQKKKDVIKEILNSVAFSQCVIFCNYITRVEMLCNWLKENNFPVAKINSSDNQAQRLIAVEQLKSFKCRIFVSSDLTARGIDAENVDLVINLDLPENLETYLHRIGRAGRFGSKAVSITIITTGFEEQKLSEFSKGGSFEVYLLPDPIPRELFSLSVEVLRTSDLRCCEDITIELEEVLASNNEITASVTLNDDESNESESSGAEDDGKGSTESSDAAKLAENQTGLPTETCSLLQENVDCNSDEVAREQQPSAVVEKIDCSNSVEKGIAEVSSEELIFKVSNGDRGDGICSSGLHSTEKTPCNPLVSDELINGSETAAVDNNNSEFHIPSCDSTSQQLPHDLELVQLQSDIEKPPSVLLAIDSSSDCKEENEIIDLPGKTEPGSVGISDTCIADIGKFLLSHSFSDYDSAISSVCVDKEHLSGILSQALDQSMWCKHGSQTFEQILEDFSVDRNQISTVEAKPICKKLVEGDFSLLDAVLCEHKTEFYKKILKTVKSNMDTHYTKNSAEADETVKVAVSEHDNGVGSSEHFSQSIPTNSDVFESEIVLDGHGIIPAAEIPESDNDVCAVPKNEDETIPNEHDESNGHFAAGVDSLEKNIATCLSPKPFESNVKTVVGSISHERSYKDCFKNAETTMGKSKGEIKVGQVPKKLPKAKKTPAVVALNNNKTHYKPDSTFQASNFGKLKGKAKVHQFPKAVSDAQTTSNINKAYQKHSSTKSKDFSYDNPALETGNRHFLNHDVKPYIPDDHQHSKHTQENVDSNISFHDKKSQHSRKKDSHGSCSEKSKMHKKTCCPKQRYSKYENSYQGSKYGHSTSGMDSTNAYEFSVPWEWPPLPFDDYNPCQCSACKYKEPHVRLHTHHCNLCGATVDFNASHLLVCCCDCAHCNDRNTEPYLAEHRYGYLLPYVTGDDPGKSLFEQFLCSRNDEMFGNSAYYNT